jgi:hypothetical protein
MTTLAATSRRRPWVLGAAPIIGPVASTLTLGVVLALVKWTCRRDGPWLLAALAAIAFIAAVVAVAVARRELSDPLVDAPAVNRQTLLVQVAVGLNALLVLLALLLRVLPPGVSPCAP